MSESSIIDMSTSLSRLAAASSLDEVVAALRSSARRLIGADGIAIILKEGADCHYVAEDAIGPLWKGNRFPADTCVSGWAMTRNETVVIPDILLDPRVPQDAYRPTFVRSMAMVPVGTGEAVAAIGAYWASVDAPKPPEIATLERLATAASDAIARIEPGKRPSFPVGHPAPGKTSMVKRRRWNLELLPEQPLPFWQGQIIAGALVATSFLVRASLTPVLGDDMIYTMFIPSILAAALLGGRSAAITATVAAMAAAAWLDPTPPGADERRAISWLLFCVTSFIVVSLAHFVRHAITRIRDHADQLERRDWQMAQIIRELDHRSRNALTVTLSLIERAARSAATPSAMRDSLNSQLQAMMAAQRMVVDGTEGRTQLVELLQSCLGPYAGEGLRIEVPEAIRVPSGSEIMLSLAFNELATNSCKHGALGREDGEARVVGRQIGDRIELLWTEAGGPVIEGRRKTGTGTRLIERALSGVLGGRVELLYPPAGLTCRMSWVAPDAEMHVVQDRRAG